MGEFRNKAKGIGQQILGKIRQIGDDEDTEVDGWLQERNGQLVNARGEVVRTFGSRA